MRRTADTALLALITILWLLGVAFLGDTVIIGAVLTLPGLGALALGARQTRAGKYQSVSPWACFALVVLAFLGLLALTDVHLHEFTGAEPGWNCDAMAQNCNPQPLQGLAHASSLLCFAVAAITILRLIGYSSHRAGHVKVESSERG